MKAFILRFSVVLALFLSYSLSVSATVVRPINFDELTGLADVIIKAKVTQIDTDLDVEESGQMVNYYTLNVVEVLKGDAALGEFVYKQIADGEYFNESGQVIRQKTYFPRLEEGRTYVLFLPRAHHATGLMAPIGLFQGVFEVQTDDQGGEVLPALKARAAILQKNISTKSNRFLKLQSAAVGSDHSYGSLKVMVEESLNR